MPSEQDLSVQREIESYQKDIVNRQFKEKLQKLLEEAREKKNTERSEETRHWTVVYTEIEKLIAYVQTYLGV